MSTKKIRVKSVAGKIAGSVDPPSDAPIQILEVEEINAADPFLALWDDHENQNITVDLIRVQPETIIDLDLNEHVRAVGFLESLPPNLVNYFEHIRNKYGGGVYRATKKVDGRFKDNYKIEISGRAKLPPPTEVPGSKPATDIIKGPVVDGVDLSGSDSHFLKMLERLVILKRFVSDGEQKSGLDSNKLLAMVMDRPDRDPLRMIQTTLELMNTLKESAPEKEVGAGWLDLLNNAIDKVGNIILTKQRSEIEDKPASGVHKLLEQKSVKLEGNVMPNYQQAAASAIVQIIASFNLVPPHTAKQAAECLDAILGLNKEQRVQIKTFKPQLLALAETEMSKQFEQNEEIRTEFTAYFNTVFDEYANPERQTFTFEVK